MRVLLLDNAQPFRKMKPSPTSKTSRRALRAETAACSGGAGSGARRPARDNLINVPAILHQNVSMEDRQISTYKPLQGEGVQSRTMRRVRDCGSQFQNILRQI